MTIWNAMAAGVALWLLVALAYVALSPESLANDDGHLALAILAAAGFCMWGAFQ